MALKKISKARRSLADVAYQRLLEAVRDGTIPAESQLVQEKLAAELQISRTPVREALLRLEQEGIVASSSRGGFKINRMTPDEAKALFQARAAIEGQAIRILAAENNPRKIRNFRKTIAKQEGISDLTVRSYYNANRRIHRCMVELCENRYLTEMFDNIWNRGISYNLFADLEKIDMSRTFGDHLRLADAIETGDPSYAMDTIIDHLYSGLNLHLQALEMANDPIL